MPRLLIINNEWKETDLPISGLCTYASWKSLATLLEKSTSFKKYEKVVGFTIDNQGITIHLEIVDK